MSGRLWALSVLILLPGCAPSGADDKPTPPLSVVEAAALVKQSKQLSAVAEGSNAFACDLYRALVKEREGNLIFSPAGVAITLAMAEAGARGGTAEQIAKALGQQAGDQSLPAAWGALLKVMRSERTAPVNQLRVANQLWVQSGYPLLDAFKQVTRQEFGAEIGVVDFSSPGDAAARINRSAETNTNSLIPDALPASALSADTRLVLMNAIYLLAKWEQPFDEHDTSPDTFFVAGTERIDVKMMELTERFRYAEREDLQFAELDYRGGDLTMIVVLPKAKEGLPSIEAELTVEKLNSLRDDAKARVVKLQLPKFKLSEMIDLNQSLMALAIKSAFDPRDADFAGISAKQREQNLYISAALQKAVIQVDEEGTEAAAVTEFAVDAAKAAVEGDSYPVFRADHPFAFFIRDNLTGTLLFAGRVVDPREQ